MIWEAVLIAALTTVLVNGLLAAARRKYRATAVRMDRIAAGGCTVPPAGWICTRAAGHAGPCAAVPSASVKVNHNGETREQFIARNAKAYYAATPLSIELMIDAHNATWPPSHD